MLQAQYHVLHVLNDHVATILLLLPASTPTPLASRVVRHVQNPDHVAPTFLLLPSMMLLRLPAAIAVPSLEALIYCCCLVQTCCISCAEVHAFKAITGDTMQVSLLKGLHIFGCAADA